MTARSECMLPADEFRYVSMNDPLTETLFSHLEADYDEKYRDLLGEPASVELNRYPAELFAEPDGAFIVLVRDGRTIAGGAFMRYDDRTAEFKRIWTHPDYRRQGLSKRVMTELEDAARRQGYERVYLTTGPLQPEAQQLYPRIGYTPHFDQSLTPLEVGIHGYTKELG